jgi:hypothetical protein
LRCGSAGAACKAMANRNCLHAAQTCHSTNFGRLIWQSQKSARGDAISCENRVENKVRVNRAAHFLQREACQQTVRSEFHARHFDPTHRSTTSIANCHRLAGINTSTFCSPLRCCKRMSDDTEVTHQSHLRCLFAVTQISHASALRHHLTAFETNPSTSKSERRSSAECHEPNLNAAFPLRSALR